jgi:hypothetical protein
MKTGVKDIQLPKVILALPTITIFLGQIDFYQAASTVTQPITGAIWTPKK